MATLNDRCTVIASRGASTAAWSHGSKARGTYEPFVLARLDGEMVDSADLEGKIAVLHFWGTWCGPCVVEMPEYQKFDERYRDGTEVAVLSISNDRTNEIIEDSRSESNTVGPPHLWGVGGTTDGWHEAGIRGLEAGSPPPDAGAYRTPFSNASNSSFPSTSRKVSHSRK